MRALHSLITRDSTLRGPSPYGCPIRGARLYVLDEDLRPLPIGANGERYIGGAGVSRGYTNARLGPDQPHYENRGAHRDRTTEPVHGARDGPRRDGYRDKRPDQHGIAGDLPVRPRGTAPQPAVL
ncbi:AMP-binding protein [Streptomyces halobius]|uniref:AMP-binding protein n=1 Tax=Streptomyces halobius TaxID=2879846 RepID=UPI003872D16E